MMKKRRSAVRPQGISFGGGEGRGREVLVFTFVFDLLLRYAKVIKKKWILDVTSWHASKWQKEMRRSPLAPPQYTEILLPLVISASSLQIDLSQISPRPINDQSLPSPPPHLFLPVTYGYSLLSINSASIKKCVMCSALTRNQSANLRPLLIS